MKFIFGSVNMGFADRVSWLLPRRLALKCLLFILIAGLTACAESPSGPPDLEQGIRVVRYMASKNQLRRSSFLVVYPEGKPSDFVNWMFSTFGTAEWPPSEEMAEMDPMTLEQAKSIRMPIIPKGVAIVALKPDEERGRQVVIRADDARGVLIVEGYADPGQAPVAQSLIKIPKVKRSSSKVESSY